MESLHLDGEMAERFTKMKIGEKVSFTVEGEIREVGLHPDFESQPTKDMQAGKEPKKMRPHVTIHLASIDGMKTGKKAKDMTDKEIEAEAERVKGNS